MEIAHYIEHTLLKPDTTKKQVAKLIEEATEYQFVGICVAPYFMKYARGLLSDSKVKLVSVVGFPLGYQSISSKVEEAKKALEDGADEIDMVINIAAWKSGDKNHVKDGIEGVATICRLRSKPLKVIIETCMLDDQEITSLCELCAEIGVDYVKTSTGFNGEGAKLEHIKLMRKVLPDKVKIKASGGIKTREFAEKLIEAGASRLGTSSGIQIIGS